MPGLSDDAYIVYPGWGFQLTNFGPNPDIVSRLYYNNTTKPWLFGLNQWGATASSTWTPVLDTNGNAYGRNTTDYFNVFLEERMYKLMDFWPINK